MTETRPKITAGIDVGKARLELSINAGPTQTYANDPKGIAALTLELAAQSPPLALAVYEPTGGYERLLATLLAEAGLPACRVHPNKVRAYARACGQQAKTDRLDAQVLSRYAAALDLSTDPSSETDDAGLRAQLKDLLLRREQLVAQRTADKSRLDKGQSDEARASAARHYAGLRESYRGLRARGKPGKVALTAVMRKLVMPLNAITVRGTPLVAGPGPCPDPDCLKTA